MWPFHRKWSMELTYDLAVPTRGISLRGMTPHGHTKAQTRVLVAALFETAQSGQAPRFPSMGAGRKAVVRPSSGTPLGSTQKQPVIPCSEGEELTDLLWMGEGSLRRPRCAALVKRPKRGERDWVSGCQALGVGRGYDTVKDRTREACVLPRDTQLCTCMCEKS